jgi:polar amino acid transport system substrate-binding protein
MVEDRRGIPEFARASQRRAAMTSALCKSGILLLVSALGCDLPRDPDNTLERVRGGSLRVGVAHNPPWVIVSASGVEGVEPILATGIARQLGARIEWVQGAQSELLSDLHDRKLDLVLGGLTDDLPWKTQVAFSRPFHEDSRTGKKHVLAAPPGENAWLLYLERQLRQRRDTVPILLRAAG